jgi:hypothetical protein
MLTLSLQTLGGSGFLQDYPIEQYIRDSKIDSLYEGTTGIQGMDLFFRKILRDQGAAVRSLLEDVAATATADDDSGNLKAERAALSDGIAQVEGILTAMTQFAIGSLENPGELYKSGLNTSRLLLAIGDLIIGWLLVRQAEVAQRALDAGDSDQEFYQGKVASARFFTATVLPRLATERKIAEETNLDIMNMPEGAF